MSRAKRTTQKFATEVETNALYESVLTCEPLISREAVKETDELMSGSGLLAVARRLGLYQASQTGNDYKRAAEDREHALLMAGQLEAIESSAKVYRELATLMEKGALRVRVALCNWDDLEVLMEEAKACAVITAPAEEVPVH